MVLGSECAVARINCSTNATETGGLFRIAVKLMMARSDSTVYVLAEREIKH